MTDTPRDDVTSDDLRERLAEALYVLDGGGHWARDTHVHDRYRMKADALLPVVAEHTAETVHFRCDCVPHLGPPHCHACHNERGVETPWSECPTVAEHTAREVQTALAEQREQIVAALGRAWDDGNATGLDGWIGPGRGEEPDAYAIKQREQYIADIVREVGKP